MCIYNHVYKYTVYICIYKQTYRCMHLYGIIRVCVYLCMYIHIYIYARICIMFVYRFPLSYGCTVQKKYPKTLALARSLSSSASEGLDQPVPWSL